MELPLSVIDNPTALVHLGLSQFNKYAVVNL